MNIFCYNEERIHLLLPQVTLFLKTWIPQIPVPSLEMNSFLYFTSLIVEASFKIDFHSLQLFNIFLSLPKSTIETIAPTLTSSFYHVIIIYLFFIDRLLLLSLNHSQRILKCGRFLRILLTLSFSMVIRRMVRS